MCLFYRLWVVGGVRSKENDRSMNPSPAGSLGLSLSSLSFDGQQGDISYIHEVHWEQFKEVLPWTREQVLER